jgi:hypothetical protein
MMPITLSIQQIENKLTSLATAQKDKHWVQSNLSLEASSRIGRCLWIVIKPFAFLREFFYGVNLDKSRQLLLQISAKIVECDLTLIPLFKI